MAECRSEKRPIPIIADHRNDSVPHLMKTLLGVLPVSSLPPITHDYLEHQLHTERGRDELRQKMDGQGIVVAALGVPNCNDYPELIDSLLQVWFSTADKPVLLLISSYEMVTERLVDEWILRHHPECQRVLRRAIVVRAHSVTSNAAKLIETLTERLEASSSVRPHFGKLRGVVA